MGGRGVEISQVVNVEQVKLVGAAGMHVLLTLDTPEGRRSFAISPEDAGEAGAKLSELGDTAKTGLFIVR